MQLLRSLLYTAVMVITIPPYAILISLLFPFPYHVRYRAVAAWGRLQVWLLRMIVGLRYEVEGSEHIPEGAAILMAKHQSTWETFAFQQIFPASAWVAKRELLYIPFFGWGLALTEPIAIDRSAGHRAVEQLVEQGTKRLKQGRWITIFPEGTRVPAGTRRRYKLGGALLAEQSGFPVVPVAHNAGTFWGRRSTIIHPGTIRVRIGPVIDPKGLSAEQIRSRVEDWVETAMMELEGRTEWAELLTGKHPGKQ